MSLNLISLWEARAYLPELVGFIREDQRRITIAYEGQRDVVLVHADELRRLDAIDRKQREEPPC